MVSRLHWCAQGRHPVSQTEQTTALCSHIFGAVCFDCSWVPIPQSTLTQRFVMLFFRIALSSNLVETSSTNQLVVVLMAMETLQSGAPQSTLAHNPPQCVASQPTPTVDSGPPQSSLAHNPSQCVASQPTPRVEHSDRFETAKAWLQTLPRAIAAQDVRFLWLEESLDVLLMPKCQAQRGQLRMKRGCNAAPSAIPWNIFKQRPKALQASCAPYFHSPSPIQTNKSKTRKTV